MVNSEDEKDVVGSSSHRVEKTKILVEDSTT
jgi:hypothetical protein